MNTAVEFRCGTENQTRYAHRLIRESHYQTVLDAAADILDRDPDELLVNPPSVEDVSRVISALESQQPGLAKEGVSPLPEGSARPGRRSAPPASASVPDAPTAGSATAPAPAPGRPVSTGPRFLTARHLRQVAMGQRAMPVALDDDAAWVLDRLKKALQAEAIFVSPVLPPVNGTDPITIEHVKVVFGDVEVIASTLGVSLPTVKSWGGLLPEHYGWKLEGLSKGRLRVPR